MKLVRHIKNLVDFLQLPKEQRKITFYSEGKNYWPHLEALVKKLLNTSDNHICYISSGNDDPGLLLEHKNFHAFKTDEGFFRNWLFENIETEIMIMTMPDLNQFQVKRSKHKVHYIYVQHSLVSLHMIYRKGAFDHYDTIFCAGPHHLKEIRAMEQKYQLPAKNLVEHGYARLDDIIKESCIRGNCEKKMDEPQHILIAPSWSESGIIESGIGEEIVDLLMLDGFKVTLRPHPQTIKFAKDKIKKILKKYSNCELFNYEDNVAGQDSLHESDIMISDWSGAAFDYAYGLGKSVIFIDVPKKINNIDYKEVEIEPLEVAARDSIGRVLSINNIKNISELVNTTILLESKNTAFNPGNSSTAGAESIIRIMENINE
jgi:hypothetical protein